jgi:hypothetical protein
VRLQDNLVRLIPVQLHKSFEPIEILRTGISASGRQSCRVRYPARLTAGGRQPDILELWRSGGGGDFGKFSFVHFFSEKKWTNAICRAKFHKD